MTNFKMSVRSVYAVSAFSVSSCHPMPPIKALAHWLTWGGGIAFEQNSLPTLVADLEIKQTLLPTNFISLSGLELQAAGPQFS